jgi:hypothetical protein
VNELENETSLNPAMTRRQLLKAAAGGITFLALAPIGQGLIAGALREARRGHRSARP